MQPNLTPAPGEKTTTPSTSDTSAPGLASNVPNAPPTAAQPAPTPERPVRRTAAQRKKERADKMRAYRAARKEKADKVAAQMGPEIQAPQPQQQTQAPSDEQKRAEEQRQSAAKEYALKERQCVEAIAGTAELVADTVHMIYLQDVDPRLGQDRARQIGELWGPLLAPHINEKTAQHLPLLLAAGGTAGALYGWAAEVRKQRAKGGLRVVAGAA